ncbi:MAG: FkbM family methyltransferase [Verrucomicrobiota bacterium]
MATTSPDEIYKRGYHPSEVNETPINCLTLSSLMRKYSLDHIDILQMDCEGMDGKIIKHFLHDGIHPAAIHFEHANLHSDERVELRNLMSSHGYDVIEYEYDCLAFQRSLY